MRYWHNVRQSSTGSDGRYLRFVAWRVQVRPPKKSNWTAEAWIGAEALARAGQNAGEAAVETARMGLGRNSERRSTRLLRVWIGEELSVTVHWRILANEQQLARSIDCCMIR